MPKVSVIVPNYNHARYLTQRIDSILNQTFQDFELILLDDCSTDNSREVLKSYLSNPHVTQLVLNETNGGSPFAQWNKGIELAKGEWIWIAESDDWAETDFLEVMLSELENHPACGLAYASVHYMRDGNEAWQTKYTGKVIECYGDVFIKEKLLYGNQIVNVSMTMFKKELYFNIDHTLYNKMRLCGDWYFYTLLCEKTSVLHVDKPLTFYRMHSENTSSSAEHQGLTFMEGIRVIDYICESMDVKPWVYSCHWGKMLSKYKSLYDIQTQEMERVKRVLRKRHSLILFYYWLYELNKMLKK